MSRPSRLAELLRRLRARPGRWLLSAVGLALAPKCLLCLAGYAGLGAALGLTGPELCGAASGITPAVRAAGAVFTLAGLLILLRQVARHRVDPPNRRLPRI